MAPGAAGTPGGTELTVDAELKVLRLLACWAEGHTLVPPFVTQVTADNSEHLTILLEQRVRVPWKDGPGEKPLIKPGQLLKGTIAYDKNGTPWMPMRG